MPLELIRVAAAAFGLGLVFNAAPGPVFAASVKYAVRGGFRPALVVQLGSLAGDVTWAVLGLAGIGALATVDGLRVPVAVAGAAYLVWLGIDSWMASRRDVGADAGGVDGGHRDALRTGVMLSLTNPQNIGYWAALGGAMGAIGVTDPTFGDYAAFFAGFVLSSLVWSFVFAALLSQTLARATGVWAKLTYRLCAIVFVALAVASIRAVL